MNEPPAEFRAWVGKAEEDWLCIRNNLAAEQKPWSVICFHAQQAAEKYLKAHLVARSVRPERTHDLGRLLAECVKFDPVLTALHDDCDKLTDYAVDMRYPDVPIEMEAELGEQAVAVASRICDAIRECLAKDQTDR